MRYFKDLVESIPDYRKIVLLMFPIKNDFVLLHECGFVKADFNNQRLEFRNILLEQNENYLDYIKDQEESIIKRTLDK